MDKEEKTLQKTTSEVLNRSLETVLQGVTGLLVSKKEERILALSHIFQRMRGGNFLKALLIEWDQFCEKGKIKEDYQFTEQHQANLGEMLDFLDNDLPDETRFDLLKKIFLLSATEKVYDRNSFLPQQLMRVSRTLSSGEIVILKEIYEFSKGSHGVPAGHLTAGNIAGKMIRENPAITYPSSLIQKYVISLSKKFLVAEMGVRNSQIAVHKEHFILTDLGLELCNFIEKYDELIDPKI